MARQVPVVQLTAWLALVVQLTAWQVLVVMPMVPVAPAATPMVREVVLPQVQQMV